jgi:HK97 family phage major capsid protein
VSSELDRKAEALRVEIRALAEEVRDKADIPLDRLTAIEAEITTKSAQLDEIVDERRSQNIDAKLAEMDERVKALTRINASNKASAILGGAPAGPTFEGAKSVGRYSEVNFLSSLVDARKGNPDAQEFIKGVLGTSTATGTAVIPNNFVAGLVEQLAANNIYRDIFNVVPNVTGAGVDIPYEVTAITAALLQGAYGSNKDIRDWSFNRATATLYTIAQIADVGNQLLRQSNGAAEASARRRLGKSIGVLEAQFITNGSGSSQPLGFFQAFLAYGDPAGFKTALSSEPRLATIGRGIAAMESRGINRRNLVCVMSSTDYWEASTEGLGTSYAGGWAVAPAGGAAAFPPIETAWGVPLYSDPNWPAAQVGTGLLIDTTEVEIYTGQEYRIDVSSEAGTRFDQNITGFRAEEEFAFNAEPYVRSGRVQKLTGI